MRGDNEHERVSGRHSRAAELINCLPPDVIVNRPNIDLDPRCLAGLRKRIGSAETDRK